MRCRGLALAALWAAWFAGTPGLAQDFQRSYKLAPESMIRIVTVSGDVKVQGYDGRDVVVEGFKVGRNRDSVEIVDNSTGTSVDLSVRYPWEGSSNASVNFEVRVPRSVSFNFSEIRSVSGNVQMLDLTGHARAKSISGTVEIRNVNGAVSADSTSGSVVVYLASGKTPGDMTFKSISGSVSVRAPADLDANIMMSTITGSLRTDFPIEIQQRRYGPGSSARGRLGTGAGSISITSVSGSVSLIRQ